MKIQNYVEILIRLNISSNEPREDSFWRENVSQKMIKIW